MTSPDEPVTVHLLQLPVPLAAQAQQHFEGLTREFMLISSGGDEHEVPTRLMRLVEALTQQYAGLNSQADQELADAIDAGLPRIADHVLHLPRQAGPAAEALGELIDEADEYCRRGQHLLTLATPPESLAYRQWYLGQVVGQLQGAPAVAWPDSPQAQGL